MKQKSTPFGLIIAVVTLSVLLIICASVLAKVLFVVFDNSQPSIDDPDSKYNQYICYDHHLRFLETGGRSIHAQPEKSSNVRYRKGAGVDANMFVSADFLGFFASAAPIIVQNPHDFVDVLAEWTAKEIVLYAESKRESVWENSYDPDMRNAICSQTIDPTVISDLQTLIDSDTNKVQLRNDFPDEELNGDILHLQIRFAESDNLVWDAVLKSYPFDGGRRILVENGEVNGYDYVSQYVEIPQDTELYNVISAYVDKYLAE